MECLRGRGGVKEYGDFLVMTNVKQLMAQAIGCKRLPFIYFALKGWHTYTRYQHSVFTRKNRRKKGVLNY